MAASPHRRRFVFALVVVILLSLAVHAPVLRFIGRALVCDDATGRQSFTHVIPASGDRRFDVAVQALADGRSQGVLLLQGEALRAEQIGAHQTESEQAIRNLTQRGVDRTKIEVAKGAGRGRWGKARMLDAWLAANPQSRVLVLEDELHTRTNRIIIDRVSPEDRAGRVAFDALRDRRFDASDWWKSRNGLKSVFVAYVSVLYTRFGAGPPNLPDSLTAQQYETETLRLQETQH